jgi:hypothetical protein
MNGGGGGDDVGGRECAGGNGVNNTNGGVAQRRRYCPPLLKALNWSKTCLWDADYMCAHAGTEQVSLSLAGPRDSDSDDGDGDDGDGDGDGDGNDGPLAALCGGPTNTRTAVDYCEYAQRVFAAAAGGQAAVGDVSHSVGYYDASSGASSTLFGGVAYGFPLNALRGDIPTPDFLDAEGCEFYRARVRNGYVGGRNNPLSIDLKLTSVLFWMGAAAEGRPGRSGLHYDVLDNFHVVLTGTKVRGWVRGCVSG